MRLFDELSAAESGGNPIQFAAQEFARRTWPGEPLEPKELEWLTSCAATALNVRHANRLHADDQTHSRMMAALEVARFTTDLELRRWARRGWLQIRSDTVPITCRLRLTPLLEPFAGGLWCWACLDRAARCLAQIWNAGELARVEVEDAADAAIAIGDEPARLLDALADAVRRARRRSGREGPVAVVPCRS